MTLMVFVKCVYLVFKSHSASILQSNNMKYQRHNYFCLRQTEPKMVPETFRDVVTAHTSRLAFTNSALFPYGVSVFHVIVTTNNSYFTTQIQLHSTKN